MSAYWRQMVADAFDRRDQHRPQSRDETLGNRIRAEASQAALGGRKRAVSTSRLPGMRPTSTYSREPSSMVPQPLDPCALRLNCLYP